MEKFKTFLNQYFWLIIIVFLFISGFLIFSIASAYQEQSIQKTIANQQSDASKAKSEAANANANAANFDIERRTEDVVRTQTIAPKLDAARRKSQNSKLELEKARKTYNEKKNSTDHLSDSDADNCRQLDELFPDVRFEGCQQN